MKRILISILTVLMLTCVFCLTACVKKDKHTKHDYVNGVCSCGDVDYSYITEGLIYTLINNDTEYMVTGYDGTNSDVIIPAIHNNKPVTQIGEKAFYENTVITSVAIAKSVKVIGVSAFSGSHNSPSALTKVTFEKNSQLMQICDSAFARCKELTSIRIPDSIMNMGVFPFQGCDKLNYNEKEGLKYLGNDKNPYIYLEKVANTSITETSIESGCKFIEKTAFSGCSNLKSVLVPNSVEYIGQNAFFKCPVLTIYCEAQRKPIGWDITWKDENNPVVWNCGDNNVAEDGCVYATINGLSYALKNGTATVARQLKSITEVNIPESITYKGISYSVIGIGDNAFNGCSALTSIEIPNTITRVGASAFTGCSKLTYKTENNFKYLGNSANPYLFFAGTTDTTITSVNINSNCKIIGYDSFKNCDKLTSIAIPEGVVSIGANAFAKCVLLSNIQIPNSLIMIGANAFTDCKDSIYTTINGVKYLGNSSNPYTYLAEVVNKNINTLDIDDSCKIIGANAFEDCKNLTEITVPNSVQTIEDSAFKNCNALTIYCQANGEKPTWAIGWNISQSPVVWNCATNKVAEDGYIYAIIDGIRYALKDGKATVAKQLHSTQQADIPSTVTYQGATYSVTSIGVNAFSDCGALGIVWIPNSIVDIDYTSFYNCKSLTFYCEATTRPSSWDINWNNSNKSIIWDYKNNNLADDGYEYVFVDGVRYALKDGEATVAKQLVGITQANIVGSITHAGQTYEIKKIIDYAFLDCTELVSVTMASSITYLGNNAFEGCTSLTEIALSTQLEHIGDRAFIRCNKLASIVIPASVQRIGQCAFYPTENLDDIIFEASSNWRRTQNIQVWWDKAVGGGSGIGANSKTNAKELCGAIYSKFYYFRLV